VEFYLLFFQRNLIFLEFYLIYIYGNEVYFCGNKDFREITPYSRKIESNSIGVEFDSMALKQGFLLVKPDLYFLKLTIALRC